MCVCLPLVASLIKCRTTCWTTDSLTGASCSLLWEDTETKDKVSENLCFSHTNNELQFFGLEIEAVCTIWVGWFYLTGLFLLLWNTIIRLHKVSQFSTKSETEITNHLSNGNRLHKATIFTWPFHIFHTFKKVKFTLCPPLVILLFFLLVPTACIWMLSVQSFPNLFIEISQHNDI